MVRRRDEAPVQARRGAPADLCKEVDAATPVSGLLVRGTPGIPEHGPGHSPRHDPHLPRQSLVLSSQQVEGDMIETADIFTSRDDRLVRADGYPPHAERFEEAGIDLARLLAQGV